MFIRFSTLEIDPDSGFRCGILVAAHTLRDEDALSISEHQELRDALFWFNENLPVPSQLEACEHRRAISWFKPEANQAIKRMWQLKALLEAHGYNIEVLRSTDPGNILYQDNWQVIAKPYKGQRY